MPLPEFRAYPVWNIFYFPDEPLPYEARRHIVCRGMVLDRSQFSAASLSLAREFIPSGMTRLAPARAQADPSLIETWY